MRAFCTVSAPLEVCASSAEQLSAGSRFLALRLLGNQQPKTLYFLVDAKSRVREVYTQTCLHFAIQGMLDTELFGLAVLIDGEYMFADPESKLSKYGPKSWRSSHTHGLDANGRPLLELHFRVQFYIESPFMLKDETSRHNYYLQLKYNALHRDISKEHSEQSLILLAGLALQADLGDAPTSPSPLLSTTNLTTTATTTTAIQSQTTTATTINTLESKTEAGTDQAIDGTGSESTNVNITKQNAKIDDKTTALAATMPITSSITTTLPKVNKRTNNASERLGLRLSTYDTSRPVTATRSTIPTPNATSTTCTATVFQLSGSLKRGLGAMAATLSQSSSISSINHIATIVNAKTITGSATTNTSNNASSAEYFRLEDYLPVGLRTNWAINALRVCHQENRGMSIADAKIHYIQQACAMHESINAHTFRMRMTKSENGPGNSWFVVYAKGIKVINVSGGCGGGGGGGNGTTSGSTVASVSCVRGDSSAQQQITFLWPNITKLSFERKKFEIRSGDNKITLYATSDEKNKMLLTLCKDTHQFSMKIAARLKEVIKREEEENNCLHACYNYSRNLHLPAYKNKNDQRISVISSTSSNTTSGIVSDRVHSEDELEIMINTPPAPIPAPSTESLALAHLLDHPSVSRQTSSVGQVSLKELEEQLAALSVHQAHQAHKQQHNQRSNNSSGGESPTELSRTSAGGNSSSSGSNPASLQRTADSSTTTDSPSSQHNIGSQCSSTCSTVVVASTSESVNNVLGSLGSTHTSINSNSMQRRSSTSSSLELGFSHTAQNSTLSEQDSTCIEHGFVSSMRDDGESISGMYTLAHGAPPTETSGVYTMHSSELTGQSSELAESEKSSHYGIFQPTKAECNDDHMHEAIIICKSSPDDAVDGGANGYEGKHIKNEDFRLRSDSNVSTSGSFRGDGSDPTDKQHTLLSAEELTDLIVGRGTYPNRTTVSSTLDSDCDYVTLPLAMKGESYLQGHQDTAPTEDHVEDLMNDLLPTDPPAPPKRIDSNSLGSHANVPNLTNLRMRSPPPYDARHKKTGLCGPPVRSSLSPKSNSSEIIKPIIQPLHNGSGIGSATKTSATSALEPNSKIITKIGPPKPTQSTPQATTAAVPMRRRDPPPYPITSKPRPTSLVSITSSAPSFQNNQVGNGSTLSNMGGSMTSLKSEEVTARFITTRPQINILKAHTSLVNDNAKPSYAAPTHCSSAASSTGSVTSQHHHQHLHHHQIPNHLSQQSVHNSNYASGSQSSLSLSHHSASAVSAASMAHAGVIPSTIGIPIVPYSLHATHKSMSSLHHQPPPPPPPYPEMKPQTRTCVLLPVIKPGQFLPPPPPPTMPRQPPPPPPSQLGGLYNSQLARKQLEVFQQQLYSDVDYVIYPIQDPAVSQQEYLDAKQGSLLAAMAQTPPLPHPYLAYHTASAHHGTWDTCKGHAIYRSTPYLPLALSTHSRYASTQNLSDTYVQLPSAYSPLYSPSMASLCSSYEPPPPPPPLHPAALASVGAAAIATHPANLFARSRSDDNILNSFDSLPKVKRLPPPPPPPYVNRRLKKPPMPTPPTENPPPIPSKPNTSLNNAPRYSSYPVQTNLQVSNRTQLPQRKPPTLMVARNGQSHMTKTSSGAQWAGERPKVDSDLGRGNSSILAHLQASIAEANRQTAHTKQAMNTSGTSLTATASSTSAAAAGASAATTDPLDIALLREKSKNLDLPLISALCNDRSLLKQTKVLVNPKQGRNLGKGSSSLTVAVNPGTGVSAPTSATAANSMSKTMISTNSANTRVALNGSSGPSNVQVSGAAAPTVSKYTSSLSLLGARDLSKSRKTSVSHRHPNDKLPPLPMQLAEANNYVMDPAMQKHHHKSYNSQT